MSETDTKITKTSEQFVKLPFNLFIINIEDQIDVLQIAEKL